MTVNIKNHRLILVLFSLILFSCQLQKPSNNHGILYLENRSNKLTLNSTNKNDVIRIIGYPHTQSNDENEVWIYLERKISKSKLYKLGKHTTELNNVLILEFNKFGVLNKKKLLKKEDLNKIKFTEDTTTNELTKKSFVASFLSSIRQKMYGNK